MRTYEALFVFHGKVRREAEKTLAGEIVKDVTNFGGQVREQQAIGRKHFARPIGKHKAGVYRNFIMDLEPSRVEDFRNLYRLNSDILRMEIFAYEPPPAAEE